MSINPAATKQSTVTQQALTVDGFQNMTLCRLASLCGRLEFFTSTLSLPLGRRQQVPYRFDKFIVHTMMVHLRRSCCSSKVPFTSFKNSPKKIKNIFLRTVHCYYAICSLGFFHETTQRLSFSGFKNPIFLSQIFPSYTMPL
jgi:hypothetical protein